MGRGKTEDMDMIAVGASGGPKKLSLRAPHRMEKEKSLPEKIKEYLKSDSTKKQEAKGEQSLRETHYI